jgi:hypothetical protein
MTKSLLSGIVIAVLLGSFAAQAATFKELASRIPADANVLVAVDIDKLVNSPMGEKENWREQRTVRTHNRPVIVPAETKRLVMGALLNATTSQSMWEVSVMELSQAPSMSAIAAGDRGYVDTIGGRQAVRSSLNAWFIQLGGNVLGVVTPAQRQFATRWAKQDSAQGGTLSSYLQSAAATADAGGAIVMAVDLAEAASPSGVEWALQNDPFAALDGKNVDAKALASLIGGIKGLTLTVDVKDEATGRCVVDFSSDASILSDVGKPMLLEFLSRAGMFVPDFQNFQAKVSGTKLVMEGKLSTDALMRLLSVLQPPSPTRTQEASGAVAAAGKSDTDDKAAASQAYYKTVSQILDKIGAPTTLTNAQAWLPRDAKRIDQLPALNVDPELLEWGTQVSAALNEAGQVIAVGAEQAKARVAAISGPGGGYNSDSAGEAQARADYRNAQRQRQQAAAEEKAKAAEAAGKVLNDVKSARAKVRADMVAKYNVEF